MRINFIFDRLNSESSIKTILYSYFVVCVLIVLFSDILPYLQDDTIYFTSAKQFSINQTCYGNSIIDFNYSKVGEFNWYGPGYHLIYGSLSCIFGFNEGKSILIFNIILWSLITYCFSKKFPLQAFSITLTLLLSPFFFYQFSFYPIILNTFVGLLAYFVLLRIDEKDSQTKSLLYFFLIIIVGVFFRISLVFLFGLIFKQAKNYRTIFKYSTIFLLLIFTAWLYQIFFCAPMYINADEIIGLISQKKYSSFIIIFVENLFTNGKKYFDDFTISHLSIWISILLIFISPLLLKKNIFKNIKTWYLSLCLVNLIYILFVFGLYSSKSFFVEKQIIILLPINSIFLIVCVDKIRFFFIFASISLWPLQFKRTINGIQLSKHSFYLSEHMDEIKSINTLLERNISKNNNDICNILISLEEFNKFSETEFSSVNCSLPIQTSKGIKLRYIWIINTLPNFHSNHSLYKDDYFISLVKNPPKNFFLIDEIDDVYLFKHN